jgi:hypothetical protein
MPSALATNAPLRIRPWIPIGVPMVNKKYICIYIYMRLFKNSTTSLTNSVKGGYCKHKCRDVLIVSLEDVGAVTPALESIPGMSQTKTAIEGAGCGFAPETVFGIVVGVVVVVSCMAFVVGHRKRH